MAFGAVGGAAFLHFNFFFLFTDLVVQSTRKESPPSWSFHNEQTHFMVCKIQPHQKTNVLILKPSAYNKLDTGVHGLSHVVVGHNAKRKTAFHTNIACLDPLNTRALRVPVSSNRSPYLIKLFNSSDPEGNFGGNQLLDGLIGLQSKVTIHHHLSGPNKCAHTQTLV